MSRTQTVKVRKFSPSIEFKIIETFEGDLPTLEGFFVNTSTLLQDEHLPEHLRSTYCVQFVPETRERAVALLENIGTVTFDGDFWTENNFA